MVHYFVILFLNLKTQNENTYPFYAISFTNLL